LDGTGSSDPDGDPLTYSWSVNSSLCTFSDPTVPAPSLTCDDDGVYEVTVTVSDGEATASDTAMVTVSNVAPTASFSDDGPVDEGSPFTLSMTGPSDPSSVDTAAGFEYAFDCGFGYGAFSTSSSAACPTDDNGVRTVKGQIRDKDGGVTEYLGTVTILNVPPTLGPIFGAPAGPIAIGTLVSLSAAFTDPGTADTHEMTWYWEDGAGDDPDPTASPAIGSHSYANPGLYSVSLLVEDDDGGSAMATLELPIVVYDPNGGFVTGGGWIHSEPGSYLPDPTLEGKATFGFVSRYKKGASAPTGNTEFQFRTAELNFHSTSYDWLVVTGSKYARFKGVGTINGANAPTGLPYTFMIWAGDGEPDTFRIKIWYEDAGEMVVYDNGMDEAIGGGQIVIHE
jgi:PKD repeat protein